MAKDSQIGQTGRLGEDVAVRHLKAKGFQIIDTNVTYKFGEIDIVALKNNTYHFVEVKAADINSRIQIGLVERVGHNKMNKIKKAVKAYVAQHDLFEYPLQLDLVMVKLDQINRVAKIKIIEQIY